MGGGGAFEQWRYKLVGGPGACSPGKISNGRPNKTQGRHTKVLAG